MKTLAFILKRQAIALIARDSSLRSRSGISSFQGCPLYVVLCYERGHRLSEIKYRRECEYLVTMKHPMIANREYEVAPRREHDEGLSRA